MSWSADWRIPRARLSRDELQVVLQRLVERRPLGKLAYLEVRDPSYAHAGIELDRGGSRLTGCLEWFFEEPTEQYEQEWDDARIAELLPRSADDEDDDDSHLLPGYFDRLVGVRRDEATIVGQGRGALRIALPSFAELHEIVPAGVLDDRFERDEAGLLGHHTRGDRCWYFGGPGLLLGRAERAWHPIETGLDESITILGLHAISEEAWWALDDAGRLWRIAEDNATRIVEIPETENSPGGFAPPWSLVPRGDELWIANGNTAVYRLVDGRATAIVIPEAGYIDRMCISGDGTLWLTDDNALYAGDGSRFDEVHRLSEKDDEARFQIGPLAGGSRGQVVALVASSQQHPPRILTGDRGGVVSASLKLQASYFTDAAVAQDRLWAIADERRLVCVDLPGPPHTRMTIRSSRDDNRQDACWHAMVDLAHAVAAQLDGWDVTSA